jgi:hypothetical protein
VGVAHERSSGGPNRLGAVAHQLDAVPGELEIPRRQRVPARPARANTGEEGVALSEGVSVGTPGHGTGRPKSGDDLIEMSTANAGRALDELQAIGHEDAEERALGDVEQALHRSPVHRHALWLTRLKADRELVRAVAGEQADYDPGRGCPEAHHLAFVGGAARPTRAPEVQSLEEVRLAGSVGSPDDGDPLADGNLGGVITTEITDREREDSHRVAAGASAARR